MIEGLLLLLMLLSVLVLLAEVHRDRKGAARPWLFAYRDEREQASPKAQR